MKSHVAPEWAHRSHRKSLGAESPAHATRRAGMPLLLCGLVFALALLSLFVQVLDEHVRRAQTLRPTQHRLAATIDRAGPAQVPNAGRLPLVQTVAR